MYFSCAAYKMTIIFKKQCVLVENNVSSLKIQQIQISKYSIKSEKHIVNCCG